MEGGNAADRQESARVPGAAGVRTHHSSRSPVPQTLNPAQFVPMFALGPQRPLFARLDVFKGMEGTVLGKVKPGIPKGDFNILGITMRFPLNGVKRDGIYWCFSWFLLIWDVVTCPSFDLKSKKTPGKFPVVGLELNNVLPLPHL